MSSTSGSIFTEQLFSRRSLGFLWRKRDELDPGQSAILDALYKNRKKGSIEGSVRVEYHLSKTGAGKLGYGRMYGTKGSLETLERECRGTLCEEFYYDIDIKNAHPVILVQFAKRYYDKDLPEVQKYCDNRDAYLKQISENRDEAKTAIIKIFYNGKNEYAFLKPLQTEVKAFTMQLMNDKKYEDLVKYCKAQKDNLIGQFLSFILQSEECKIMLTMRESFIKYGWSVDVLAYDGVMIRKDPSKTLTEELLRNVEKDALDATNYQIELISKAFEKFEVPTDEGEVAAKVSKEEYLQRKAQFEENHFYYLPTNTIARVNKYGKLDFYEIKHAKYVFIEYDFAHSKLIKDKTSFLDLWLNDTSRRTIERIDQKPNDDPSVYSPPVVFEYTKHTGQNDKAIDYFTKLVKLASGNNDLIFDYMLKWIAHIVQKPFENPRTAIVLTGEKGCGKDTLGDFIASWIVGMDYSHNYTSTTQFWDVHDCDRMNKFFIKLEEASGALNRKHVGDMKAQITSFTLTVNPKGVKSITSSNYNRYFMSSNEAKPVKAEDNERRFIISPCSPEWVGKHEQWIDLRKHLFTKEGAASVGNFLMNIDLSQFNPSIIPENEYMNQVIESEESSESLFLKAWDGEEISTGNFYTLYRSYCIENGLPYVTNSQILGHRLTIYLRDGKLKKKRMNIGFVYHK